MTATRTFCSLGVAALIVGWYQLPVLAARSQALTFPGHELVTQTLESASAGIGQPAVALRSWSETQKLQLQAHLLTVGTPKLAPAARARVETPRPPPAPAGATMFAPADMVEGSLDAASATLAGTSHSSGTTSSVRVLRPAASAAEPVTTPQSSTATDHDQEAGPAGLAQEKGVIAVLAGDSVMGEIAFGMKRWAAKSETWTVVDAHKVSSGLSNQGYYDWPATFHSLVEAHKPGVVLMMVGANDAQDIYEARKRHGFGSEQWREVYGQRVQRILSDASNRCLTMYWVLQPTVREPGLEKRLSVIREIIREKVQAAGGAVHLIDANARFVDDAGRYVVSATIQGKLRALRTDDGVHLTYAGAQVLVDAVLDHASHHPQVATPACTVAPAGS